MPDHSNPEMYERLAREWQIRAAALPPGEARDVCRIIADGYVGLARLIDAVGVAIGCGLGSGQGW